MTDAEAIKEIRLTLENVQKRMVRLRNKRYKAAYQYWHGMAAGLLFTLAFLTDREVK